MNRMTRRRQLRWAIAPVLGAALVVTAMTWDTSASAGDHPQLPARTAAQLLTAVQQSTTENLSDTVKVSARLGLPSIPDSFANPAGISVQTFLAGTHTFRVWVRCAEQQRLALIADPLAETDVIHNN